MVSGTATRIKFFRLRSSLRAAAIELEYGSAAGFRVGSVKVALVTNYWKDSEGGGIKTYLVDLVDALTERGVDVRTVFREGDDPEQYDGGKNKLSFVLSSYRFLQRYRPEVIHSQETWYCLLPSVLYKKLHGGRVIHTFHTEPDERLPLPAKVVFQNLLDACDCVTFVSKRLQERVIEIDGLSIPRTAITYAGVKAGNVSEEDVILFRDRFGIAENAIVLAAIGMTALPYKAQGLKLLIQAVRILRESFPGIVLIATREGKYSEEVKAFARETGVDENVIFTGNIENALVPLAICDVYTHITLGDGLPLALLEAMAMGKPIIATPIAGIPEAITDTENGLLVAPDPEQIAERISSLLRDRDYAERLGASAKRTADERFTWDRSVQVFESLYDPESLYGLEPRVPGSRIEPPQVEKSDGNC